MKKTTNKKLTLSTETVRALTPTETGPVMNRKTTAITCTCTTTAMKCGTTG